MTGPTDDAVADLLERALHDRPDDRVDVHRLMRGTRQGVRRARTRRRVTVAAGVTSLGVAAAALPVTVARWHVGGAGDGAAVGPGGVSSPTLVPTPTLTPASPPATPPATPPPSPSPWRPEPEVTPNPTPAPSEQLKPGATAGPLRHLTGPGAGLVPASVLLTAADFDRPMKVYLSVDGTDQAPIDGQMCNDYTPPHPREAVAISNQDWGNEQGDLSVDVAVSVWAAGTGASAFADVRDGVSPCTWLRPQTALSTAGLTGDEVWVGTDRGGPGSSGHVLVRHGDVVVAVSASEIGGSRTDVLTLARRAATAVAARVAAQMPQAR